MIYKYEIWYAKLHILSVFFSPFISFQISFTRSQFRQPQFNDSSEFLILHSNSRNCLSHFFLEKFLTSYFQCSSSWISHSSQQLKKLQFTLSRYFTYVNFLSTHFFPILSRSKTICTTLLHHLVFEVKFHNTSPFFLQSASSQFLV